MKLKALCTCFVSRYWSDPDLLSIRMIAALAVFRSYSGCHWSFPDVCVSQREEGASFHIYIDFGSTWSKAQWALSMSKSLFTHLTASPEASPWLKYLHHLNRATVQQGAKMELEASRSAGTCPLLCSMQGKLGCPSPGTGEVSVG